MAGTEGVHFQMAPYRSPLHAARFYGLGAVGNPGKVKSIVALAVTPTAALSLAAAASGADEGAGGAALFPLSPLPLTPTAEFWDPKPLTPKPFTTHPPP